MSSFDDLKSCFSNSEVADSFVYLIDSVFLAFDGGCKPSELSSSFASRKFYSNLKKLLLSDVGYKLSKSEYDQFVSYFDDFICILYKSYLMQKK